MRKLSLTFPDQITEELSLLCYNRPKVCRKQGTLGWTSNERILIVRKGFCQYYNLHPGFVEDDVSTLKDRYFKGAIHLDLIHQVNYLPKNKIKKNIVQLIFPKSTKVTKQPTENQQEESETVDRNIQGEEDLQKWVFEFRMDVKQYVQQRREQYKLTKRKMAQLVSPDFQEEKLISDSSHSIKHALAPNNENQEAIIEKNIEEYADAVQKTKEYLKSKAEAAEEEAARMRKKKEKALAQLLNTNKSQSVQQTYSIAGFWRDYFKAVEQVGSVAKQKRTQKAVFQSELNLLRLIQYFNSAASNIVKNYVNERAVGWNGINKMTEGFGYYQGLWIKVGGKELNQEFLVNYYLNDIFYSLPEIKGTKFRIPLMSLIKYKGSKLLVMSDLPYSELEKTQVYNLLEDGFDLQLMGKLRECLEVVEDVLNVKSQPIEVGTKKQIAAPLGVQLKIYEYNFKKDKTQDNAVLPNFYYLINPGIVFPLDYSVQKPTVQPLARLRPQLVAAYRDFRIGKDTQLLSQAFMKSTMPEELMYHEEQKVIEACKWLQKGKLKHLAQKLNKIELLIVDSYSIKTMMKEVGVNMRHLHILSNYAQIPYIREHLLVDALARTIKKQFRATLQDLQDAELANAHQYQKLRTSQRFALIDNRKNEGQQRYKSFALDYLNLVFGCGPETLYFWKIIIKKCKSYFNFQTEFPPKVKPGMLLHAVLWHCNLKAVYPFEIPLFKSDRCFNESSQIDYKCEIKTFDFPSFEIQKLFRGSPSLEDNIGAGVFEESTVKLLKLQLLFFTQLRFSFETSVAIAKMSNFSQYLRKIELQNPLHPVVIPYYIVNKSQRNFYKALDILNFSLPENHPLFVTLHYEYSTIFQAELLKKAALMMAVRNFGQFHPRTTQIYSALYHQGATEYYFKARRILSADACRIICAELYRDQKYESCLSYVLEQMEKMNASTNSQKLGTGNYQAYLDMLIQGLQAGIKTQALHKAIQISEQISNVMSSFKLKDSELTLKLLQHLLLIHLLKSQKKYFLYKLVLLTVHIRQENEKVVLDQEGFIAPVAPQDREQLIQAIAVVYYAYQTHSNWINDIIETLQKSFQYFNFLEDLFNNYKTHLRRYNSQQFKMSIGYWDILIRLYGQAYFNSILYDIRFY